jgi:tripartite ATP-independent transporter DctM subunit
LPLLLVVQQMFQQTQSFPMLALPFFILAGTLIMEGRLGEELLRFAGELMKRVRGGPLATTVVGSMVFGGVSGSAVANASALGSVLIPWQKGQGYPAGMCAANNATSAVIDILIPPSIPMILYAVVSGVSVGDLFLAGVLPGLLMAFGFIGVCWWNARKLRLKADTQPIDIRAVGRLAFLATPALILPILILMALRFGFATPTEVAVMAVLYSLAASILIYRDMSWRRFRRAMIDAGIATGIVMLVIMGSAAASWILTFDQIPQRFAAWVSGHIDQPWLVILAMNLVMLIIGGPLDLPPAILLLAPIFVPLAQQIGLDLLQLGLIMVLNLGIGLYTPPVGTTLFISSSIAGSSMSATVRELWPYFWVAIGLLVAISYIPALTIRF